MTGAVDGGVVVGGLELAAGWVVEEEEEEEEEVAGPGGS
jgi:hypothetical protein